MVASQVAIGAVGITVVIQSVEPPSAQPSVMWILVGVGVIQGVMSFGVSRFIKGNFLTISIVRWAFAESAMLLGFVAGYLSGSVAVIGIMMGYALALLAVHAPTENAKAAVERREL